MPVSISCTTRILTPPSRAATYKYELRVHKLVRLKAWQAKPCLLTLLWTTFLGLVSPIRAQDSLVFLFYSTSWRRFKTFDSTPVECPMLHAFASEVQIVRSSIGVVSVFSFRMRPWRWNAGKSLRITNGWMPCVCYLLPYSRLSPVLTKFDFILSKIVVPTPKPILSDHLNDFF